VSDAMAGSSYSSSTGNAPISAADSLHRVRPVDPDGPQQDAPGEGRKEDAKKRSTAHGAVVVEDQLQISPEALARSYAEASRTTAPGTANAAAPSLAQPPVENPPSSFETVA